MTLVARILEDDPQKGCGIKLLCKCDDEHQYRKKWFPSEAAMDEAMVRAVSSVSASDLIDFTSAGLLSKAQRDIHPPGTLEEWLRIS
jgi:hypothetical protein